MIKQLKQKDLMLLGAALFFGILISLLANKYLFANAGATNTQVDVVPVISTSFPTPSSQFFNAQSVDPTQIINISPGNAQQPFNGQ